MDPIADLILSFTKFPGVGNKSARRMVFYLLKRDSAELQDLGRRIATLKDELCVRDIPVYDLTGYSGALLEAAGCRIERPASADWAAWSRGKEQELLIQELDRRKEGKVTAVMDGGTPKALRRLLESRPEVFSFGRLSLT